MGFDDKFAFSASKGPHTGFNVLSLDFDTCFFQ